MSVIVKKRSGELVEVRRELTSPDLVLNAIDTDALLSNAKQVVQRTLVALQSNTQRSGWTPDIHHTKQLKECVEVTLQIHAHEVKQASNDALANLTDEELTAMLRKVAQKKLGA